MFEEILEKEKLSMHILITIVSIIVLFILGAWFVSATSKCKAQSNHGAFGIGFMFSATVVIALFKVIMSI